MHRTALTTIAPAIFRKRLLVEGYFGVELTEETIRGYFTALTAGLSLRPPAIRRCTGPAARGGTPMRGSTALCPLIDSGIYIGGLASPEVPVHDHLHVCPVDEDRAVALVGDFFELGEHQAAVF